MFRRNCSLQSIDTGNRSSGQSGTSQVRDHVQKIEVNSGANANKSANEHSLVGWLTTSCAVLRLDGAVVDTHSHKQTLIATSTAEAEMYGILSVTFEGVSIGSLFS